MRTQQSSTRFRQRKLNTKSNLRILREADLEPGHIDLGASINGAGPYGDGETNGVTSLPKVESGVESKEEKEHHLQAAINAAQAASIGGKVAAISIPTPDAVASSIKYDVLHPSVFTQPATYIRFSSTVEDSTGVQYSMDDEDEKILKSINTKATDGQQCSEDQFEQVMNAFEDISLVRQPFAAVDANTPVLGLEELEAEFDMESVDEGGRLFAADIYEYWKGRRVARGNKTLMPKLKTLKMDSTGQDADDADPYVCFRRREVRQARKTRGRDTQVAEKLKKLRRELEEARSLLSLVKERESSKREHLAIAKQVYEQRAEVRDKKRSLGITDETDDLLIDQKEPKRPKIEINLRQQSGNAQRMPPRQDLGPTQENDLVDLRLKFANRERSIALRIDEALKQRKEENNDFVDKTSAVVNGLLSPNEAFLDHSERQQYNKFTSIKPMAQQQPTPPPSIGSASEDEASSPKKSEEPVPLQWANFSQRQLFRDEPRFRFRRGRGGRFMVDRHNFKASREASELGELMKDRFKHDHDDGDESDDALSSYDEVWAERCRAAWALDAAKGHARINSREAVMVNGQSTAGMAR